MDDRSAQGKKYMYYVQLGDQGSRRGEPGRYIDEVDNVRAKSDHLMLEMLLVSTCNASGLS